MPLLFSYGMLQRPEVQLSTFGRLLKGTPDELVGYKQTLFKVEDPAFVAESGKEFHAMAIHTGSEGDRIPGVTFELTDEELAAADEYEPDGYVRVVVTLASGREAWLYTQSPPNR